MKIKIWVRRAGPNYEQGLRLMRETAETTGLSIHIYGPETHVTAIVPLALDLAKLEDFPEFDDESHTVKKPLPATTTEGNAMDTGDHPLVPQTAEKDADHKVENFNASTRCFVYGLQHRAVQGMLDFDFMCKREKPSVAALIFPFSPNHYIKVRSYNNDRYHKPIFYPS